MAFARYAFLMASPDPKSEGRTVAETVDLLTQRGIKHHLAEGPECPHQAAHVWGWWQELHKGRQGGFGPLPLSWEGIKAWADLHGLTPTALELRWLRAVDDAWLVFRSRQAETAK